jgi:hypothetical protein
MDGERQQIDYASGGRWKMFGAFDSTARAGGDAIHVHPPFGGYPEIRAPRLKALETPDDPLAKVVPVEPLRHRMKPSEWLNGGR